MLHNFIVYCITSTVRSILFLYSTNLRDMIQHLARLDSQKQKIGKMKFVGQRKLI